MEIRTGGLADVPQVVRLHLSAWDAAKEGLDLPTRPGPDVRRQRWTDFIESGEGTLLVADDAGLVGFLSYGPSRDADRAGEFEVYTLYVDPGRWGTGVADALMAHVPSSGVVSLWVAQRNARARGFYARHGYVADGATDPGHHVPVIRLARPHSTPGR